MDIKNKKIRLTTEETKKIRDLFSEHYNEDDLRRYASMSASPEHAPQKLQYFTDIFNKFSPDELRNVKSIEFDNKECSRKQRRAIMKIFDCVNTINRWAHFPEDMLKYQYFPKITFFMVKAFIDFTWCILVCIANQFMLIKPTTGAIYLFDFGAILTIFQLAKAVLAYVEYQKKLKALNIS